MIPFKYYNYINIWDLVVINELLSYHDINYNIKLFDGSIPVIKKTYNHLRK